MDTLTKYPADPNQRVNGENTALSLVAHETGHRWGATLRFRDGGGGNDAWLGRQLAHWSFFTDSDASVLEGNEIQDSGGSFRTGAPSLRYSPFDLYAMGLLREAEVRGDLLRGVPRHHRAHDRRLQPRKRAALGREHDRHAARGDDRRTSSPRWARAVPAAGSGPREHRQAWIYVTSAGRTADPAAIAKLETFRRAFEDFFAQATGGRMTRRDPPRMSVRLGRGALEAIRREAARAYPHEACGALVGSSQADVSEAPALRTARRRAPPRDSPSRPPTT